MRVVALSKTGNRERQWRRNFITEDFMKKKKALWIYAALAIGGAMWFAGCEAIMELLGFGSVAEADAKVDDVKEEDAISLGGGSENQNPSGGEGDENPPDGSNPGDNDLFDPLIPRFYVSADTGDDGNDGLTEETAFKTLAKAYTEALADDAHKRIVVLTNLSETGAVAFDQPVETAGTILIEGATPAVKIERSDGANDSVIEITNGAKVRFRYITINGKINPDENTDTSNNRALKITGTGTKVTLEDGVVVTGKKRGGGATIPTEADGSGVLVSGLAELVMTGTARITQCVEEWSHAKGAVVVRSGGKLTMDGGEISFNTASDPDSSDSSYAIGGGVYVYGLNSGTRSALVMSGGAVISNNTISGSYVYGGGVRCANYADLTMTDAQIKDNTIIAGINYASLGGGVYAHNSTITMNSGAVISGNVAKGGKYNRGGGVNIHLATLTMNGNALISTNTTDSTDSLAASPQSQGGGVFINTIATLVMNDSAAITGNSATGTSTTGAGGGVYLTGGTLTMNSGTISGNTATGVASKGGGVYQDGGTFNMPGGTITATNVADTGKTYYAPGTNPFTKPSGLTDNTVNTTIIAGVAQP
jgi:hypothetical protein